MNRYYKQAIIKFIILEMAFFIGLRVSQSIGNNINFLPAFIFLFPSYAFILRLLGKEVIFGNKFPIMCFTGLVICIAGTFLYYEIKSKASKGR